MTAIVRDVRSDALEIAQDVSPGEWLAGRLRGDVGSVTDTVPSGYSAYARVFHPATDQDGAPVAWSDVALMTGRTAHPLMQWHALVGSQDPEKFRGSLWQGRSPERGNLPRKPLQALCDILAGHTTEPEHCFFAIWIGWGWVDRGKTFSSHELRLPHLELPDREYVLLTGPLTAASETADAEAMTPLEEQSPNLFWPADHAWCVGTEIDFDSTLVGGTTAVVQAIVESAALEAWQVNPTDSLTADADRINALGG